PMRGLRIAKVAVFEWGWVNELTRYEFAVSFSSRGGVIVFMVLAGRAEGEVQYI
nr:hypothetical protein [Tanacetum cinerariifolium]